MKCRDVPGCRAKGKHDHFTDDDGAVHVVPRGERILPCPFCGSREVVVCRTNPMACWIRCDSCGGEAQSDPRRAGALRNWNRREPAAFAEIVEDDDRDPKVTVRKKKAVKR